MGVPLILPLVSVVRDMNHLTAVIMGLRVILRIGNMAQHMEMVKCLPTCLSVGYITDGKIVLLVVIEATT